MLESAHRDIKPLQFVIMATNCSSMSDPRFPKRGLRLSGFPPQTQCYKLCF